MNRYYFYSHFHARRQLNAGRQPNHLDGNASLSTYSSGIAAILASHQDYSIVGDLNTDDLVGDNDLNMFVANRVTTTEPAMGRLRLGSMAI